MFGWFRGSAGGTQAGLCRRPHDVMSVTPCLLLASTSVSADAGKQATASAADLTWLWAALIGFAGALVGGWFVLLAGRQQRRGDREDARKDRSQQATMAMCPRT